MAEGSAEHYEQSERAKQMAWRHVELALKGDQPDSVDKSAGTGQLTGSGFYRYHGDPWGDHEFFVHATAGAFFESGLVVWRPTRDTFEDPHAFCNNATRVRVRSDGVQVWRCNGHDVSKGEPLKPVEAAGELTGETAVELDDD